MSVYLNYGVRDHYTLRLYVYECCKASNSKPEETLSIILYITYHTDWCS